MKKENKKSSNKKRPKKVEKKIDLTFKQKTGIFLKHNYIYIIMVVLVVMRIGLGWAMGAWYGFSEIYDDVAMMQGLSLKRLTEPTNLALIKDLSYSLFLGFSAVTNLPYTVVLSGFWALTAFVVWLLVRKVTDKKWVQLFAFSYVLFLPIAFTSWGGLRVYRNAIIAPCIILTFSLALMLLMNLVKRASVRKTVWLAILTGISFAFTYFLKEDGIWLKACMLVFALVYLGIIGSRLVKEREGNKLQIKRAAIWTLICLAPFMVLFVWDNVYRGVNHAFFGVYEINTRTEGELGKFVFNVYKIDSPNRTTFVWAPYDAIQAAFEASPTLKSYPKLLDEIMTTGWNQNDIIAHPIGRDYLTWVMRSELLDAGMWTSEEAVNNLFAQVNKELEEAFNNGTLKKTEGRIQILSSTGGYTWEEIVDSNLVWQVGMSLADANWMVNYDIGFHEKEIAYGTKGKEWDYSGVNKVLHMNDLNIIEGQRRDVAHASANIIYIIYRVINTVVIIVTIIFYGWLIVDIIKNRKRKNQYFKNNVVVVSCAITGALFFGVTIVYSFATAWFFIDSMDASFNQTWFVFQRVGISGLMVMVYVPIIVGSEKFFSKKIMQRVKTKKIQGRR